MDLFFTARSWVAARPWLAAPLALSMLPVIIALGIVALLLQVRGRS